MYMQRCSESLGKSRVRDWVGKCGGSAGLTAAAAKNAQIGVPSVTIGGESGPKNNWQF